MYIYDIFILWENRFVGVSEPIAMLDFAVGWFWGLPNKGGGGKEKYTVSFRWIMSFA